jgi:hypothetical protein
LVLGSWFLVLGSWFLVLGERYDGGLVCRKAAEQQSSKGDEEWAIVVVVVDEGWTLVNRKGAKQQRARRAVVSGVLNHYWALMRHKLGSVKG